MSENRSTRETILLDLLEEFRTCGFEGVSLSRISEVTGLGKASLYHYFPGGKGEMAQSVMSLAADWLEIHVFRPLEGEGEPKDRLESVLKALEDFYQQGQKPCLLDVMTIGGGPKVRESVKAILLRLLLGFEHLALDAGIKGEEAKARAESVLVAIEGSLIVSRGLGDNSHFLRQMKGIRERFLN